MHVNTCCFQLINCGISITWFTWYHLHHSMQKPKKKEHQEGFLLCFVGFLGVLWVNLPKFWPHLGPEFAIQRWATRSRRHQLQHGLFLREFAVQVTRKHNCACFMSEIPSDPTKIIISIHLSLFEDRVITYVHPIGKWWGDGELCLARSTQIYHGITGLPTRHGIWAESWQLCANGKAGCIHEIWWFQMFHSGIQGRS